MNKNKKRKKKINSYVKIATKNIMTTWVKDFTLMRMGMENIKVCIFLKWVEKCLNTHVNVETNKLEIFRRWQYAGWIAIEFEISTVKLHRI